MTVDFHAHLAPEEPRAPKFLRHLFDVDGYLERQAAAGIEHTVLSYSLGDGRGRGDDVEDAKLQHAFLADLVSRYPDRFTALAGIDPFGGSDWLAEAERALDSGFAGFCFPTSRRGRYLDSSDAADAFALANERRAIVLVHPSDTPVGPERTGDPFLTIWIGRPYDVGLCLARMLIADTLGPYPDIRVVVAQGGGTLATLLGRLDHVLEDFRRRPPEWGGPLDGPADGVDDFPPVPGGGRIPSWVIRLGIKLGLGPRGAGPGGPGSMPLGKPGKDSLRASFDGVPSERVGGIFFDTAVHDAAAIRAEIAAFGVDRIVLGTDHPPVGKAPGETVDLINELDLADEDREKILGGNARRILQASVATAI